MPRANASVTNPPLLVDNDATGMCPVPFLDLYPAISAVFVIIIVIVIGGMAITGETKEREESQADVATVVVTVMAMLRIGG
jgi:hypothetical protein